MRAEQRKIWIVDLFVCLSWISERFAIRRHYQYDLYIPPNPWLNCRKLSWAYLIKILFDWTHSSEMSSVAKFMIFSSWICCSIWWCTMNWVNSVVKLAALVNLTHQSDNLFTNFNRIINNYKFTTVETDGNWKSNCISNSSRKPQFH